MSNINALDRITSAIARAIYQIAPASDWNTAKMVAKFSPSGAGKFAYEYRDGNGVVDNNANPDASKTDELILLTMQHFRLSREISEQPWFGITVTVQKSGKFHVDFEYMENYTEGDIFESQAKKGGLAQKSS